MDHLIELYRPLYYSALDVLLLCLVSRINTYVKLTSYLLCPCLRTLAQVPSRAGTNTMLARILY